MTGDLQTDKLFVDHCFEGPRDNANDEKAFKNISNAFYNKTIDPCVVNIILGFFYVFSHLFSPISSLAKGDGLTILSTP